jgi:hypothetical protein
MISRETPFIGGKSLLFSWGALNKICDKYGMETFGDFDTIFLKNNIANLKRTDIVELIQIGLERRDKKGNVIPITTEEVNLLIEKFMDEGNTITDLFTLLIGAIYGSLVKKSTPQPQGEVMGEMNPPRL